ncbi:MAG: class I SAM-dependent methyltransferase [Gammaproteobacteria bacterium]|nr:class I SAM-dependent methyltransferase [Gammaproteobacteria bacterium]
MMKASAPDEVCELYEASADWYSEMMDSEIDLPLYSDTLGRLHHKIEKMQGTLIDTACGSGHMLKMYHDRYDKNRSLLGIDLSPRMVAIASDRLGSSAQFQAADMRDLNSIEDGSAVAVINFFALHHLDSEDAYRALCEWNRVLQPNGQLVIATWEGAGAIDYGDESDIVALRYRADEIVSLVDKAGFNITRSDVEPVEGFSMDAIYLEGTK